ncbi:MAG TPA: zf-HC2 domain-containing protein [Thermoanaerobaculia bacterium]|nr:zf-HC2 domain-containing protein [Thermoanaerobaculia bacterium]
MDHAAIDENHIAERYVQGRLEPEEARRFEEHFLGCAECLERVELAERLQAGLQRAAVRRAATAAAAAVVGGIALRSRLRQRLLAGLAFLLALALPTALLLPRVLRLDRELAAARLASPAASPTNQSRPAPPGPAVSPAPPTPTLAKPPAAGAAAAPQESAELAAARSDLKRLAGELERARAPQLNIPILALSLVRSGPGEEEPAARLHLPAAAPWAVVSVEPSDPGFPSYRAVLRAGSDSRWQGEGLTLGSSGLLSLTLPREFLDPGLYTLEIEGRPASGAPVPSGTFRFKVD